MNKFIHSELNKFTHYAIVRFMEAQFMLNNVHLDAPEAFAERDTHLALLRKSTYIYEPPILNEIPLDIPGIYTLTGGRQIGKTTLAKQWMNHLLQNQTAPNQIAYFTGELITDHFSLVRILQTHIEELPQNQYQYIIIDEVTYIKDWDKGIKFLADAGLFDYCIVLLTGSDSVIIKEARMRFPGRRGSADKVDFHLYPLSFREVICLQNSIPDLNNLVSGISPNDEQYEKLYAAFSDYLIHGGYLKAINEYAQSKSLSLSTLIIYSDWIRGDVIKRDRSEHYLREILHAIIKRMGSQITWNALLSDLSIDHPKTISDYINMLADMDVVFVQSALLEDKLTAAPKKAKKVILTDPFIYHAIRAWIKQENEPFEKQIKAAIEDPILSSSLVEACVVSHYRRHYPTYYIKAKGEVDVVYVDGNEFYPCEVKWTNQLRTKDLQQIQKYPNAKILTRRRLDGQLNGTPTESIPWHLFQLDVNAPCA